MRVLHALLFLSAVYGKRFVGALRALDETESSSSTQGVADPNVPGIKGPSDANVSSVDRSTTATSMTGPTAKALASGMSVVDTSAADLPLPNKSASVELVVQSTTTSHGTVSQDSAPRNLDSKQSRSSATEHAGATPQSIVRTGDVTATQFTERREGVLVEPVVEPGQASVLLPHEQHEGQYQGRASVLLPDERHEGMLARTAALDQESKPASRGELAARGSLAQTAEDPTSGSASVPSQSLLAKYRERVLSTAPDSARLVTLYKYPDELASLIFVVGSIVCFLKLVLMSRPSLAKAQEVLAQKQHLYATYRAELKDAKETFRALCDSTAYAAEAGIDQMRGIFQQFAQSLKSEPGRFGSQQDMTERCKQFVQLWLQIYSESSIDPVKNPLQIVSERDLGWCRKTEDVADLLVKRLDGCKATIIKDSVSKFRETLQVLMDGEAGDSKTDKSRECGLCKCSWISCCRRSGCWCTCYKGCWPIELSCLCMNLTLLSCTHCVLLLVFLSGAALLGNAAINGKLFWAWAVGIGELFLFFVLNMGSLYSIEELQHDVKRLEALLVKTLEFKAETETFYSQVHSLSCCWKCRTLPLLENFKEVHDMLWNLPSQSRYDFLVKMNDKLKCVSSVLGPLHLWIGKDALKKKYLKIAADQLGACTKYIKDNTSKVEDVCRRMESVVGIVVVHVLQAQNLKNTDWAMFGDKSDPYATISFNGDPDRRERTQTVNNNLSPRWDEEFVMAAKPEDSDLYFEVFDADSLGNDVPLGYHKYNFRDSTHGVWRPCTEQLRKHKNGELCKHSQLEFEVFFASDVRQLKCLSRSPDRSADVQSLTSFFGTT